MAKGGRTHGRDFQGNVHPLYNPRQHEPSSLGWYLHFTLDLTTGMVLPRTLVAEATATTLNVNSPNRVFARLLQIQSGLIA